MKLKIIVSLLVLVSAYQSSSLTPTSWWRNVISPHTFTTATAYLTPLLVYKQRASGSSKPISSYTYLAPLAMTLAQTMATCGQKGWQNSLMTTLQWQLPAWALAYYLSYYKERYDQENKEQLQYELYKEYPDKLADFLQKFDAFLIKEDIDDIPDDLKGDYNNLLDLYARIMDYSDRDRYISITPAQELYVRYIAYKVATTYQLPIGSDTYDLYKYIMDKAEDDIKFFNEKGLVIDNDPYSFIQKFKNSLKLKQKDKKESDPLLVKIYDAIKHFKEIQFKREQEEREKQEHILLKSYHELLDKILNGLYNQDIEVLYRELKNIYNQLQKREISDRVMSPSDAIYTAIVAQFIKPSIDNHLLNERQENLNPNDEQDVLYVVNRMQEFTYDIEAIINRSSTLAQDIKTNNASIQQKALSLNRIMLFINDLREQNRQSFL